MAIARDWHVSCANRIARALPDLGNARCLDSHVGRERRGCAPSGNSRGVRGRGISHHAAPTSVSRSTVPRFHLGSTPRRSPHEEAHSRSRCGPRRLRRRRRVRAGQFELLSQPEPRLGVGPGGIRDGARGGLRRDRHLLFGRARDPRRGPSHPGRSELLERLLRHRRRHRSARGAAARAVRQHRGGSRGAALAGDHGRADVERSQHEHPWQRREARREAGGRGGGASGLHHTDRRGERRDAALPRQDGIARRRNGRLAPRLHRARRESRGAGPLRAEGGGARGQPPERSHRGRGAQPPESGRAVHADLERARACCPVAATRRRTRCATSR